MESTTRKQQEEHVHTENCGHGLPVDPYVRPAPKTGRNDPCPCGSGKKFKKCCASAPRQ